MKKIMFLALVLSLFASVAVAGVTIEFGWEANAPGEQVIGYRLYQSTMSGVYDNTSQVKEITGGATTCTLDVPDGEYYFVLTAYNAVEESTFSNEITVTAFSIKPSAPGGFSAVITKVTP